MKAPILAMAVIALAGCETPASPAGTTLWHEQESGAEPSHRAVFDHPQDCRRFVNAMEILEPDTRWFCK